MKKPDPGLEKLEGIVEESLPDLKFKVRLTSGDEYVLAHLGGKMKLYRIRVVPGDKVVLEVSRYDRTRGRIVRRL